MKEKIVLKFGGTSVSSYSNWQKISSFIQKYKKEYNVIIVISALVGVTDKLISISSLETSYEEKEKLINEIQKQHEKLAENCGIEIPEIVKIGFNDIIGLYKKNAKYFEPEISANIIAYGEILSSRLGKFILEKLNINCNLIDTRDIIKVNYDYSKDLYSNFLDADINLFELKNHNFEYEVVIMQGFICSKLHENKYKTCLLGRGGSDTCGSLISYITNAKIYKIYKDVNGIYDKDPNKNKSAKIYNNLSYDEAYDISLKGAKIIHHKCIEPLKEKKIICIIKNINENVEYTKIS
jgi:diaminopimelate decarboxylase/aspartate kinase